MSSSPPILPSPARTPTARTRRLLGALLAVVSTLLVVTAAPASAQPAGSAVPAGTWDGRSRLVVTVPDTPSDAGNRPPMSATVTVDGTARPAETVPVLSDRTATAVVVDASAAGGPALERGRSGAAGFVLATPPAARSALVADTTPPAVVSPLQAGPAATLRGLAGVQPGGDRQTGAALDLALAQLPPEADAPRVVLLYTGGPDTPTPAADLAARLTAAGAVLAVVVPAADGTVPPYWSTVAAATGGVAVAAPASAVTGAFDGVGAALRTRLLVTFPAPDRLPATAVVRVDTPRGPVTAATSVAAPSVVRAAARGPAPDLPAVDVVLGLVLVALLLAATVVAVRRHARRPADPGTPPRPEAPVRSAPEAPARAATRPTWAAWNVPDRPPAVAVRDGVTAALRSALRAGRPAVLRPADAASGTGTTTAMIEFAHARRADYDVAWWVPAADPPLVADRLAELAEALGLAAPTDTAREAAERLRGALGDRGRWLLVLDDAGSPRQLAALLPDGPGHVLVSSDDPDWAQHAVAVPVPPLRRDEATALLRAHRPSLTAQEADGVAAALDDAPAAVDLAGATLADTGTSVSTYLRLLSEHGPEARPDGGGAAACAVALDRLSADRRPALDLLTMLAWLGPDPVPRSLLTAHADVLPASLRDLPARLPDLLAVVARRGLARVDADSVQLHRLPAAALLARSGGAGDAGWATAAVRLLRAAAPADPADPAGRTAWRRLLPHVLAVTDPGRRLDDVLLDVGWLLQHAACHLRERGEPRSARALFEDAHALYRDRLGPAHPDTVAAARTLAEDLDALGEHDTARRVRDEVPPTR